MVVASTRLILTSLPQETSMRSSTALRLVPVHVMFVSSVGLVVLQAGCLRPHEARRTDRPPPPIRELRGVFVTTAYNIDWPPRPGLHWRVQSDEINAIVNRARELHCNVIFLQVRAFGDRIHRHTTLPAPEPWSAALN